MARLSITTCGCRPGPFWRAATEQSTALSRYNGAEEKGIRDLKAALDQRQQHTGNVPKYLASAVEVIAYELNHRSRRCLNGRTVCAVFHDGPQHLLWTKRQRQTTFRLLLQQFGAMIGNTTNGRHPRPATAWRVRLKPGYAVRA